MATDLSSPVVQMNMGGASGVTRRSRDVARLSRRDGREPALIWVLSNTGLSHLFDRVLVFDRGQLVDDGAPDTLAQKSGVFKELVSS